MIYSTLLTNYKYSHQPYLFSLNNKLYLLFTGQNVISNIEFYPLSITDNSSFTKNILWQLYISELDNNFNILNTKFIATGYFIICSPILFEEQNKLYLSFLGGNFTNFGIQYSLIKSEYNLTNNKILNSQIIKSNCFYGCINSIFTIYGNRRNTNIKVIFNNNKELYIDLSNNFNHIYRVIYLQENFNNLLITGNKNDNYKTLLFDIEKNQLIGEIKVNNNSIYKSVIKDNYCIFSNKKGTNFEDRELILTDNFKIE